MIDGPPPQKTIWFTSFPYAEQHGIPWGCRAFTLSKRPPKWFRKGWFAAEFIESWAIPPEVLALAKEEDGTGSTRWVDEYLDHVVSGAGGADPLTVLAELPNNAILLSYTRECEECFRWPLMQFLREVHGDLMLPAWRHRWGEPDPPLVRGKLFIHEWEGEGSKEASYTAMRRHIAQFHEGRKDRILADQIAERERKKLKRVKSNYQSTMSKKKQNERIADQGTGGVPKRPPGNTPLWGREDDVT